MSEGSLSGLIFILIYYGIGLLFFLWLIIDSYLAKEQDTTPKTILLLVSFFWPFIIIGTSYEYYQKQKLKSTFRAEGFKGVKNLNYKDGMYDTLLDILQQFRQDKLLELVYDAIDDNVRGFALQYITSERSLKRILLDDYFIETGSRNLQLSAVSQYSSLNYDGSILLDVFKKYDGYDQWAMILKIRDLQVLEQILTYGNENGWNEETIKHLEDYIEEVRKEELE